MKLERQPVERMQKNVDNYKKEKTVWNEVDQALKQLQDEARKLYGFQNPFSDRKAVSSDESVLSATAKREAPEHQASITVQQLAEPDSFLSKEMPFDYEVPAGKYGIKVGKDEVHFTFRGGKLQAFADTVNRAAGKLVSARVVNDTANTQVMMISALKTGAANTLSFLDDGQDLAVNVGLIERSLAGSRDVAISPSTVVAWTQPLDQSTVTVTDGTVTLPPQTEARLTVSPPATFSGKMDLELEVELARLPGDEQKTPSPPPGPSIPGVGSVSRGGVTIENGKSQVPLPPWNPPPAPKIVEDHQVLFLLLNGNTIPLPDVPDTDGFRKITVPVSTLASGISAIGLRNRNTHRELAIRSVRLYNPESRGGYEPVNPVTRAQDAKITVDGIQVVRDSNTVTDLLPGTTITLNGTSSRPVTLNVQPDRDSVKNEIIAFVGRYNQVLTKINILTSNNQAVVDEVSYFDDSQKKQAMDELGMFQGDTTLTMVKSHMQNVMMSPFPTRADRAVTLLAQIGISTSASTPNGGGIDFSRMRGYLEINENQLDDALKSSFFAVKDLFGNDTNGDLIVDQGAAYKIDQLVTPYVQTGGIIAIRTGGLDTQISQTTKEIDSENERLSQREAQLKQQYAQMQGTVDQLQKDSKALAGFSNQGQNSSSGQ